MALNVLAGPGENGKRDLAASESSKVWNVGPCQHIGGSGQ